SRPSNHRTWRFSDDKATLLNARGNVNTGCAGTQQSSRRGRIGCRGIMPDKLCGDIRRMDGALTPVRGVYCMMVGWALAMPPLPGLPGLTLPPRSHSPLARFPDTVR